MTGGKTLFEQFPSLESRYTDENDEPIDITTYDCLMHVVGTGSNRSGVVVADVGEDEKPKIYDREVPPEDLFDTSTIVPEVSDEEMEQLIAGVSLKDIFAARRNDSEDTEEKPKVDKSKAQQAVDEIFP